MDDFGDTDDKKQKKKKQLLFVDLVVTGTRACNYPLFLGTLKYYIDTDLFIDENILYCIYYPGMLYFSTIFFSIFCPFFFYIVPVQCAYSYSFQF